MKRECIIHMYIEMYIKRICAGKTPNLNLERLELSNKSEQSTGELIFVEYKFSIFILFIQGMAPL